MRIPGAIRRVDYYGDRWERARQRLHSDWRLQTRVASGLIMNVLHRAQLRVARQLGFVTRRARSWWVRQ